VTPTSGSQAAVLLDTSVAVALALEDHEHHEMAIAALAGRDRGLAGHAAFETYSVLTRLPSPARRSPGAAIRILTTNFPHTRHLSAAGAAALLQSVGAHRITGGSIYDALVGAAAREHGLPLATLDRRALSIYGQLGVDIEFLG
jgi:predicted nucleic acid-binding protein